MGLPAARLGDLTAHGGSVTTGDTTVLIGGRPAARLADLHLGPPPTHVSGPILPPGAVTVLIGGRPAARITDKLGCACGAADVIVTGEYTVLIGDGGGGPNKRDSWPAIGELLTDLFATSPALRLAAAALTSAAQASPLSGAETAAVLTAGGGAGAGYAVDATGEAALVAGEASLSAGEAVFSAGEPVGAAASNAVGIATPGGAFGQFLDFFVPPPCAYLREKPFTFVGNISAMKPRSTATLGPRTTGNYTFDENNATAIPAERLDLTLGEHQISLVSVPGVTPPEKLNLTIKALEYLPTVNRDSIDRVVLTPYPSPHDAYWQTYFNNTNVTTVASATGSKIVFYPSTDRADASAMTETMLHESGHTFRNKQWTNRTVASEFWANVTKMDGRSLSEYGDTSPSEDLAESMAMYGTTKGTPCEPTARWLYPARYAALDKLIT